MNIATWAQRHAGRLRDAPAAADGERVHATWGEFAARSAAVAGGLRGRFGLAPGDRVAIVMRNRPAYLEALFGAWHAGLVAVPVNARLHRDEIAYVLDHSGTAVAVTDPEHADAVVPLVGQVEGLRAAVVAPGPEWDALLTAPPVPLADRAPTDPAWLFCTSGTTGRPKGATLTHRTLLMASLSYFADIDPVAPSDAVPHAAPRRTARGSTGCRTSRAVRSASCRRPAGSTGRSSRRCSPGGRGRRCSPRRRW